MSLSETPLEFFPPCTSMKLAFRPRTTTLIKFGTLNYKLFAGPYFSLNVPENLSFNFSIIFTWIPFKIGNSKIKASEMVWDIHMICDPLSISLISLLLLVELHAASNNCSVREKANNLSSLGSADLIYFCRSSKHVQVDYKLYI